MKRVAVLMGGWSAEREVSLSSGRECTAALTSRGYDVRAIEVTRDLGGLMAALTPRPDVVFNALHGTFYDYTAKYEAGGSDPLVPAPIHPRAHDEALAIGLGAHRALGCRGVSRSDLRYDDTAGEPGKLYLLEINTQPGMTPTSLVPDVARHAGIDFGELVHWMVENAACDP